MTNSWILEIPGMSFCSAKRIVLNYCLEITWRTLTVWVNKEVACLILCFLLVWLKNIASFCKLSLLQHQRHNKRSEKKAKELEEQQKKAAEEISTVNCVAKGGVKEEGVVLSLEKLVEGSSMVTGASDVFSPPERKPEDSINKKNLPPTSPLHNIDHLQVWIYMNYI